MGIWYAYKNVSIRGIVKPYQGPEPAYYDLAGIAWYDELVKQLPSVQQLVRQMLERGGGDMSAYYNTGLVSEGAWQSRPFLVWGVARQPLKTAEGKALLAYFKNIPGIVSLSISVLKPHTHIKPHNGDTDATYRMHLPVVIPAGLPQCGIKVDGISRPWNNNDIVVFCDAHRHEAWNETEYVRVVLIVDVVKPAYLRKKRWVCFNVLCWLLLQKIVG